MRGPYYLDFKEKEIKKLCTQIGCEPLGQEIMLNKVKIMPLYIKEVPSPAANILKQHLLSLGGDVVVARGVVNCSQKESSILLLGTRRHYRALVDKIAYQPWGLKSLSERLHKLLTHLGSSKPLLWSWGEKKLVLGQGTLIMGILNLTPDSFSDGGKFMDPQLAVEHAWQMVEAGADVIDVGAESTRPGYQPITAVEEIKRLNPVVEKLLELPVPLSLDTYKAEVAAEMLALGVNIINDIGGGLKDPHLPAVVARFQVPVIVMHSYFYREYQDVLVEVVDNLAEQAAIYQQAGVPCEKIVIDPGIGFAKNLRENLTLIRNLVSLKSLGFPLLLGASRKTFIGELLDLPPDKRLEGSLAAAAWGILQGVDFVRVHDVEETVRLAKVLKAVQSGGDKDDFERNN